MENLPIDINYNKLLDWLINRRHCGQQWPPVAADWAEILRLYEKDSVFLAEAAQMLARNVNYEIPAVKKQIARCQQLQKECERKETELANNAADLRKKYAASCRQIGIEGQKIKTELAALVRDLPADFDRIAASSQELAEAVKYYDAFVAFLTGSEQPPKDSLQILKFVQSRGNVTAYEWRTGTPPEVVEEQSIRIDTSDEQDDTQQTEDIDWGAGDDNGSIDFGEEIDFGIAEITVESGGQEVEGNGDSIDWGDVGTDSASLPEEKGVARGDDALSVLDNPNTRNLFIDDLMELESFLSQRIAELHAPDVAMSGNQFQGAPAIVQLNAETVEEMEGKVQGLLGQLTSVQMQHLMLIRSSPRYVDRLRDSLRQTLVNADKLVLNSKTMSSRRREALQEEQLLEPRLDALRQHTRTLQAQLEVEIAEKYKGRKVNIMGEINMI
ncbi:hypothetical protein BaRGS_00021270 [Batillaria attramentaria]|uniref:CDK5 regulatory subunit-associated protein 3 n=1 Tax=Batillaria attramentaria TaxID=370345 RepID=A0ABD0KJT2_9CAEN